MKRVLYLFLFVFLSYSLSLQNVYSFEKKPKSSKPITVKVSDKETKTFANKAELKQAVKNGLKLYHPNIAAASKPQAPNAPNFDCDLLVPWAGGLASGWNLVTFGGTGEVDDDYEGPFALGFNFQFYGISKSFCYIGSNGFITFEGGYDEYSALGFPITGSDAATQMIAGYWEDIETVAGPAGEGLIYWKQESGPGGSWNRFTILFYKVNYFHQNFAHDLRNNTFEIILTDGNDPLIGIGKNIAFSYGDMQWASAYPEGGYWDDDDFYSDNGTVGINAGDGHFFAQIGRFGWSTGNHPLFYNGPYSLYSNVNWLDYQNNNCGLASGFDLDISGATSLIVTKPTLNLLLTANQTYHIEWNSLGLFNILLEFSPDNGAHWSIIESSIPSTDGGYLWNVPQVHSTQCLVRATSMTDPNLTSTSQVFTIWKIFQFINGNGGERYPVGSSQEVTWRVNIPAGPVAPAFGNNNVSIAKALGPIDYGLTKLEYSADGRCGPWTLISATIYSYFYLLNSFYATVPNFITNTGLFKLTAIYSYPGSASKGSPNETNEIPELTTYSDDYWSTYTISNSGRLIITDPNSGSEKLIGGSYYYIKWTRYGGIVSGQIALEYSSDGGQNWNRINTTPLSPILMRYYWQVPKINSNNCYVRIVNALSGREYDRSDNAFSINSTGADKLSNYPNPFNPTTKIKFYIDKNEMTSLKVFNSLGQEIKEIVNKQLNAGYYEYEFNASSLPSGIYYYELRSGSRREINKMILVK